MSFDINEIKAQAIGKDSPIGGYVRPNLCLVTISPPAGATDQLRKTIPTLTFLASNFVVPGMSFNTIDIKRQGMGLLERRTTGINIRTFPCTFFLDAKGSVLKYLTGLSQLQTEYNPATLTVPGATDGFYGEVGYFDSYACQIEVQAFAPEGDKIINYKIIDATLASYDDVALGWAQNNEIATVVAQFNFRSFTSEFNEPTKDSQISNRLNLFQFIAKYKGAIEVVKSLKKPSGVGDALNLLNNAKTLGMF
jgi:hypothetical protein